jgi:hypothetical protein
MKPYHLLLQLFMAFSCALAFLGLALCLGQLPLYLSGAAYQNTDFPGVLRWMLAIAPTEWFPIWSAPLVFWSVFRGCKVSPGPVSLLGSLFLFHLAQGAFVLQMVIFLHSPAVMAPPPTPFRVLINGLTLGLLAGLCGWVEWNRIARPKAT